MERGIRRRNQVGVKVTALMIRQLAKKGWL